MRSIATALAVCALFAQASTAQTCTTNVLDGFNVELPAYGGGQTIGQIFTSCGTGSVSSITIHEGDQSTGGPYSLWIAPEAGGFDTVYTVMPVTDTIADPGGAFPRVTTLTLNTPFPVTGGTQYRFILDNAGAIDIRCSKPSDYGGGFATAYNGIFPTYDLDFEVDITDLTWIDLGGGSPGTAGTPRLAGEGSLVGGTPASLTLISAPPGAAMLAWVAIDPVPFAALGGTVHAYPFALQLLLFADAGGGFNAVTTWPVGLPPGTELTFQFLAQDVSTADGIILSNGLRATTP